MQLTPSAKKEAEVKCPTSSDYNLRMNEITKSGGRFRFSIANLLLLTAVVAICIMWLRDHRELQRVRAEVESRVSREAALQTELRQVRQRLHEVASQVPTHTRNRP